ncbi:MAG: hypothetical protein Q4B58_00820 [Bacteroidales bacterium]|nr:hypothetical protein [Bacteroidales bacterium]
MSAENIAKSIELLKQQIEQLKKRCQAAEARIVDLNSQKLQSQLRVAELEQSNQELISKYKNLQAGAVAGLNRQEMAQMKARYLTLIKEIDDCIEKLNG